MGSCSRKLIALCLSIVLGLQLSHTSEGERERELHFRKDQQFKIFAK